MLIADFELERYFAKWEFNVAHLLCASDPEPLGMSELLALADPESERLWRDLRLGYTETPGHPLLRAEIARGYRTVGPDQVLVCSGAEEAVFLSLGAILGSGRADLPQALAGLRRYAAGHLGDGRRQPASGPQR